MATYQDGGPKAENGSAEHTEYAAMMRRMLRGWARRLADADVEDVAELARFSELVTMAQVAVVASMREHGRSWADVGRAFGISRQGAAQRFTIPVEAHRARVRAAVAARAHQPA